MERIQIAALCLVTLIGVTGCSSDSDLFSVVTQDPTEATQSAIQQIATPAIEGLDPFGLLDILGVSPAVRGGPSPGISQKCSDYSEKLCTNAPSGGLEVCYTETGEVWDFDQCLAEDGKIYDGTLTLGDVTQTLQYSLTIDGTRLSGLVAMYQDFACITETFFGFSVTRGSSTGDVSGELEYCDGEDWPYGRTTFMIDDVWQIDMMLENEAETEAMVTNVGTGVETSCTVDLASGEVSCGT